MILLVGVILFGGISNLGNIFNSTGLTPQPSHYIETTTNTVSDADAKFMNKVLKTTEDYWITEFKKTQPYLYRTKACFLYWASANRMWYR